MPNCPICPAGVVFLGYFWPFNFLSPLVVNLHTLHSESRSNYDYTFTIHSFPDSAICTYDDLLFGWGCSNQRLPL